MKPILEEMFPGKTIAEIQEIVNGMKPRTIEFPDLNPRNSPQSTLANFEELLTYYNIMIRHNEMTKQTEIDIPSKTFHRDTEMNAKVIEIISLANKQNFPDKNIMGFITLVANKNAYHPVRDWINEQTWDGKSRLKKWYDSVVLEIDNPMKEVMMYKWALSAVAALYHEDFACEGVLTYQSPQGRGKTRSIESILPRDKRTKWTKDGVVINTNNKDSLMKALGYWITEMGEIDATFRKSDMEQLKAFITEKMDEIRPPYERTSNKYIRRTVFYGSVNEQEFLQDSENRRFWVLAVKEFRTLNIDVGQFWAELKHCYDQIKDKVATAADCEHYQEWGWFMSPAERERMKSLQTVFKSIEPIEQILETNIVPYTGLGYQGQRLNCTTILLECGLGKVTKRDTGIAANWLRNNGFVADGLRRFEVNIQRKDHAYKFEDSVVTHRKLPNNPQEW
jgi:putative DNA primase/helicase